MSRCPQRWPREPTWPAFRSIREPSNPLNCLWPYTVRVTTDTIIWLRPSLAEPLPPWSRARNLPACAEDVQRRAFAVDDTLAALHRLAARACEIWRAAEPGRRIGAVAGSVGKTTTKEILAALVGARLRVLKTQGNLNNEYGLPLTLLKVDDDHQAIVLEMGMSHRGELARLAQIARPDVGVITRIAVEHLEFFSSIEEIALAERELIENLPWPHATAVLNADDERVAQFAEVAHGPVYLVFDCRAARRKRRTCAPHSAPKISKTAAWMAPPSILSHRLDVRGSSCH